MASWVDGSGINSRWWTYQNPDLGFADQRLSSDRQRFSHIEMTCGTEIAAGSRSLDVKLHFAEQHHDRPCLGSAHVPYPLITRTVLLRRSGGLWSLDVRFTLNSRHSSEQGSKSAWCHKLKNLAARAAVDVTASNTGSETDRVWRPPPSDRLAPPSDLSADVQPRRAERRCEIALPRNTPLSPAINRVGIVNRQAARFQRSMSL